MIRNEDAYYTGYYRNVRALGAIPALVFDTIVRQIRVYNSGEIANNTIQELMGVKSKRTIIDAINDLIAVGWIECTKGNGSGNKSVYILTEKGVKNAPFIDEKGAKNAPKRVQKMHLKGIENAPFNNNIKEIKESGSELRETQSPTNTTTQLLVEKFSVGSTPTPPKNENAMKGFDEFWNLYPEAKQYENEKENCERVWFGMRSDWKEKLLTQLREGKRWRPATGTNRDNPIWYLRNYNGEDVPTDLPFMLQGSATFGHWIDKARNDGKKIVLMFYQIGDDRRLVYVLESDRAKMEAAGAQYVRDFN